MFPIAAIIVARRNKYIRTFRQAGAISPRRPLRLSDAGLRRSIMFNLLVRQRIIVPVDADMFYLDENREQELHRIKRPLLAIVLVLVLLVILISFYMNR